MTMALVADMALNLQHSLTVDMGVVVDPGINETRDFVSKRHGGVAFFTRDPDKILQGPTKGFAKCCHPAGLLRWD